MNKTNQFRSPFLLLIPIGLLLFGSACSNSIANSEDVVSNKIIQNFEPKQKGVHVFRSLDTASIQELVDNNFEWITYVPFGYQEDYDTESVRYRRGDPKRMARRDSMWRSHMKLAHDAGLKVFLKPHIWMRVTTGGKWRSDIFPKNDENWEEWKKSYREFILFYAEKAEQNEVDLFCIGAELTRLTLEKSEFWETLIQDVRKVYSGKLTYAANWYKEYENITFWNQLDYIGVQAYFPLVKNEYPTVAEISNGWNKFLPNIEAVQKKYNRPVLFTELGYKSTSNSAIKPWEWIDYSTDKNPPISLETQANSYQAFFDAVWEKEWFAGVHIWQWRADFDTSSGKENLDFTPQGKPAAQVIAKGFE